MLVYRCQFSQINSNMCPFVNNPYLMQSIINTFNHSTLILLSSIHTSIHPSIRPFIFKRKQVSKAYSQFPIHRMNHSSIYLSINHPSIHSHAHIYIHPLNHLPTYKSIHTCINLSLIRTSYLTIHSYFQQ